MENKSIFLGTNIVADMIDSHREHHENSILLLRMLIIEAYKIVISEDMLSTLYFISKDKKATLEFFENIIYIDWHIASYGMEVIREATHLSLSKKIDLEDALQCLCAKKEHCTMIVTEDKQFVDCGINITDYKRFLK